MVETIEPTRDEMDAELAEARKGVTDIQAEWCKAYIGPARFNAVEASRIVGTSFQTRNNKYRPNVERYIHALLADSARRWHVSKASVLAETVALAFSNIADVVDFAEGKLVVRDLSSLPLPVQKSIKEIKLKRVRSGDPEDNEFEEVLEIKLHDKLKPLEILAKAYGVGVDPSDDAAMLAWKGVEFLPPQQEEEDE